mmetsp:Transcript_43217/g.87107  ORF Transcript_43217/g.87107 Transcript_43217/m.87107 type:complete len:412 (+) Transcript_43217:116-1351(+)
MASLLSQAFAPVFQAFRARSQSKEESDGTVAEGGQSAAPVKTSKGLPEIDYPVPLVVKNTFIDAGIGRPLSMEGFYLEREIHSTPVSLIEGAAGLYEAPFEPTPSAKHYPGKSDEPDGSVSCTSTSAGGSPVRSGIGDSPSGESEASALDAASPCSPADERSAGASGGHRLAGLPEFEYPSPLFVKNTFIDTDIGRPFSIDGFYEERQLRSCPGSALFGPPEDCQEFESSGWAFPVSTPECTPLLPYCQPRGMPFSIPLPPPESLLSTPPPRAAGIPLLPAEPLLSAPPPRVEPLSSIPLPPAEPPVLPAELAFQEAPTAPPAVPAPASAPAAPVLLLSDALEAAASGAPALPSAGSSDHRLGTCKPCAHAYSTKGCRNGADCTFCHLCPPGELKRQQRVKRMAHRKAGVA